jgi:hypothetical protein
MIAIAQGDAFGFMKLCAFIITELKNLSAASRASIPHQQQMNANSSAPAAVANPNPNFAATSSAFSRIT